MVTQNEINSQQRDMNGFIKILPLNKNDAKEHDLLEAFKSFDKILKSDSQKQNISFNKYFYDVVATEKNNLINGKTPVNSAQEINSYMIGLRKEILDNADKFTKQLQQAKNDRERVFIVQPKNAKQQAIEDTFQGFYHNCVKPYREMNGKQLSSEFYQKWQETKNYMVSNEVPMSNVEKYLNNTLNQQKQGAYDKIENYSNKDYARSNSNQWGNKQERKQNSQWNNNGYQQWNKEKKQDNAQQDNQWEQKSYKKSYGQTQQQGWNANTGYGNNANNSNNYNSVNKVNNYNTQQSNQQQSGYQKKSNSYGNYNQDNQQQQENYNQGYQKKNNDYNKGQNQSSGYSSSNSYNEQQDEVKTQKNTNYNNLKQKPYKRK